MGTLYNARPKKFVTAKNRPKFCAISDNFSKIGKALENLQPLPRWMKKKFLYFGP